MICGHGTCRDTLRRHMQCRDFALLAKPDVSIDQKFLTVQRVGDVKVAISVVHSLYSICHNTVRD
jgi:hypothetical protein